MFYSNGKSNIVKKAAVSVLLISSISINMAFAKESESNTLKEIYHIYYGWSICRGHFGSNQSTINARQKS